MSANTIPARVELTTDPTDVLELVSVNGKDGAFQDYPEEYQGRVVIDVVHDGHWVPEEFLTDEDGRSITLAELNDRYVLERDWGASFVAARLAANLGLSSFCRVNVARVLMDFGRFPGSTPRRADHLHRYAINYPFSQRLSYRQKKSLLENYYDVVSGVMERELRGKLLKIGIHTYDETNESGTVRPPMSIMTRSIGYQTDSEMPWGLFDPLYPDILGEFTSDRVLRDRMSLYLERSRISVAHNYPYCLPEGSLEVRYQVWVFFAYLQQEFEKAHPETAGLKPYQMVWDLLQDTNLRSTDSEALRSYLHMFRKAPDHLVEDFRRAERAYDHIQDFVRDNHTHVVENYRFSPDRPSAIAVEVRKDIAYRLDERGRPIEPNWATINRIGDILAAAVQDYLRDDHQRDVSRADVLERSGPWYTTPKL